MFINIETVYTTKLMVLIKDPQDGSDFLREIIEQYNIPSSEWVGGQVFDDDNRMIGAMIYALPSMKSTAAKYNPDNPFESTLSVTQSVWRAQLGFKYKF